MGAIIDGNALSKDLNKVLKAEADELKKNGIVPKLTVLFIGDDSASSIYVKNKEKASRKVGITCDILKYPDDASQEEIINKINELNNDPFNHGILVQLPLPKNFDEEKILLSIAPEKDVDGFHPINIGKLVIDENCLMPCTPSGILQLIESTEIEIAGKDAVVVGRSNIVGKPIALMLLKKNATVTICHSKTINLPEKIRGADILVAAIGRPEFIRGDWIKRGAVVIDVGINRLESGKIIGDVQFETAKERASFITPVPGGVGPMTISMLLKNTLIAARSNKKGAHSNA